MKEYNDYFKRYYSYLCTVLNKDHAIIAELMKPIAEKAEQGILISFEKVMEREFNKGISNAINKTDYSNRIAFYFSPSDDDYAKIFAGPIIALHFAVLGALITGPIAPAVVTAMGVGVGAKIVIQFTTQGIRNFYNSYIRTINYHQFDHKKNAAEIDSFSAENETILDAKCVEFVFKLKRQNLKMGDSIYVNSTTIKFYYDLRESYEKLTNKKKQSYGYNFSKNKSEIKALYFETIKYFDLKKDLEDCLKVNISTMKSTLSLIVSKFISCENIKEIVLDSSEKKGFINSGWQNKSELYSVIKKYFANEDDRNFIESAIITMFSNESQIINSQKTPKINRKSKEEFELIKPESYIVKYIMKGTSDAADKIFHIKEPFEGAFGSEHVLTGVELFLALFEATLYISDSVELKDKFHQIAQKVGIILQPFGLATMGYGLFYLFAQNWINKLADNSIAGMFYINPMGFLSGMVEGYFFSLSSNNTSSIWNDIFLEYLEYLKKEQTEISKEEFGKIELSFYKFAKLKNYEPDVFAHRVGEQYKKLILNITNNIDLLNKSVSSLLNSKELKRLDRINPTPILEDVIKIVSSIYFIASQLRALNPYIQFLENVNIEIDETLKKIYPLVAMDNVELVQKIIDIQSKENNDLIINNDKLEQEKQQQHANDIFKAKVNETLRRPNHQQNLFPTPSSYQSSPLSINNTNATSPLISTTGILKNWVEGK